MIDDIEFPETEIRIHYHGGHVGCSSIQSMAKTGGVQEATVFDSLRLLIDDGWLTPREDGDYDATVPDFGPASPIVHASFMIVAAALRGEVQ